MLLRSSYCVHRSSSTALDSGAAAAPPALKSHLRGSSGPRRVEVRVRQVEREVVRSRPKLQRARDAGSLKIVLEDAIARQTRRERGVDGRIRGVALRGRRQRIAGGAGEGAGLPTNGGMPFLEQAALSVRQRDESAESSIGIGVAEQDRRARRRIAREVILAPCSAVVMTMPG